MIVPHPPALLREYGSYLGKFREEFGGETPCNLILSPLEFYTSKAYKQNWSKLGQKKQFYLGYKR